MCLCVHCCTTRQVELRNPRSWTLRRRYVGPVLTETHQFNRNTGFTVSKPLDDMKKSTTRPRTTLALQPIRGRRPSPIYLSMTAASLNFVPEPPIVHLMGNGHPLSTVHPQQQFSPRTRLVSSRYLPHNALQHHIYLVLRPDDCARRGYGGEASLSLSLNLYRH